jgi:hypothetical protein
MYTIQARPLGMLASGCCVDSRRRDGRHEHAHHSGAIITHRTQSLRYERAKRPSSDCERREAAPAIEASPSLAICRKCVRSTAAHRGPGGQSSSHSNRYESHSDGETGRIGVASSRRSITERPTDTSAIERKHRRRQTTIAQRLDSTCTRRHRARGREGPPSRPWQRHQCGVEGVAHGVQMQNYNVEQSKWKKYTI